MQKKIVIALTIITLSSLILSSTSKPAYSLAKLGSGYTTTNFFSLVTSLLTSFPNNDRPNSLLDGYAHIFHCDLVKENFYNEFEWTKIREILNAEIDKIDKEYYRYYEFSGPIYLNKYNFQKAAFPIALGYSMKNVGVLNIYTLKFNNARNAMCSDHIYKSTKGRRDNITEIMPSNFFVKLVKPITIEHVRVSPEKAKRLVELWAKNKVRDRKLYIRFRTKISTLYSVEEKNGIASKVVFNGKLEAIDIFIDSELTIPFTSIETDT